MKKYLLVAILMLLLSVAAYAYAATVDTQDEPTRICTQCGMNSAKSPVEVKFGDKYFMSPRCWGQYAAANEIDLSKGSIVDYTTVKEKDRLYIDLPSAFFVVKEKKENTVPPYMVAFSNEDAAKKFAQANEGALVGFNELSAKVAACTAGESCGLDGKCMCEGCSCGGACDGNCADCSCECKGDGSCGMCADGKCMCEGCQGGGQCTCEGCACADGEKCTCPDKCAAGDCTSCAMDSNASGDGACVKNGSCKNQ